VLLLLLVLRRCAPRLLLQLTRGGEWCVTEAHLPQTAAAAPDITAGSRIAPHHCRGTSSSCRAIYGVSPLHPAAGGCLPWIGHAAAAKQCSQRVLALRGLRLRRVLGRQLRLRGVPLHGALLWRRLPLLLPAMPQRCRSHGLPLRMCLHQICIHSKESAAATASTAVSSSSSSGHSGAVVLDGLPGASALPLPPGPGLAPSRQVHLWHRAAPPRSRRPLLRAQATQHRLKLLSQRQGRLLQGLCCWCSWAGWGLQGGCAARQGGRGRVLLLLLLLLSCRRCFSRCQAAHRRLHGTACMHHGIPGATRLQKRARHRQAGLTATAATRRRRPLPLVCAPIAAALQRALGGPGDQALLTTAPTHPGSLLRLWAARPLVPLVAIHDLEPIVVI
jgi:hypothetical protein